jgi:hypothetical protein
MKKKPATKSVKLTEADYAKIAKGAVTNGRTVTGHLSIVISQFEDSK